MIHRKLAKKRNTRTVKGLGKYPFLVLRIIYTNSKLYNYKTMSVLWKYVKNSEPELFIGPVKYNIKKTDWKNISDESQWNHLTNG